MTTKIKPLKKPKKAQSDAERLKVTPSVIKKLFAYSGNRCANPACKQELIDEGGTMLGKMAHIHAALNGARHDPDMTDEQRRDFANLIVICGICHDKIDDPKRENEFPAELLREWKERHEARFKKAEAQFVDRYRDSTEIAEPTYPKTLDALATALNDDWLRECEDHIKSLVDFIAKLRRLPLPTRDFATKLARRMKVREKERLPVEDVTDAFDITDEELARLCKQLDDHELGYVDDDFGKGYVVRLRDLEWGGNPFIEMLDFCDATGIEIERLLYDLNFALFDSID
jgi:hypothetical protein